MPTPPNRVKPWALLCVGACLATAAFGGNFESALERMDAKEYAEAEAALEKLVLEEPGKALYWFNLGGARYNQGKIAEAETAFAKVVALESPLAPAARLSLAKCKRRQEDYPAALALLREMEKKPAGLQSALASELETLREAARGGAMEAYEGGRYETALAGFRAADGIRSDAEVTLMLGLSLMRLNRRDEAKPALRRAESQSRGGPVQDQSRFFVDKLEKLPAESPFWAFAEMGIGYNSNVFLEGSGAPPSGRAALQTTLGAGADVFTSGRYSGELGYLFYWEEAVGDSSARFLAQTLRLDMIRAGEPWRLGLTPSLQYQTYGSDPFLLKASLAFQGQRPLGRNLSADLRYELGKSFGQLSEYRYLDGGTHALRMAATYSAANWEASLQYALLYDDTGDLTSGGVTLPLKGFSHGPGARFAWRPAPKWELAASMAKLWRRYASLAVPDGIARRDGQFSLSLRAGYQWRDNLQGFVSLGGLWNGSTLDAASAVDDRNYSQVISLVGVAWDILN